MLFSKRVLGDASAASAACSACSAYSERPNIVRLEIGGSNDRAFLLKLERVVASNILGPLVLDSVIYQQGSRRQLLEQQIDQIIFFKKKKKKKEEKKGEKVHCQSSVFPELRVR
jgi:hypothetical protein